LILGCGYEVDIRIPVPRSNPPLLSEERAFQIVAATDAEVPTAAAPVLRDETLPERKCIEPGPDRDGDDDEVVERGGRTEVDLIVYAVEVPSDGYFTACELRTQGEGTRSSCVQLCRETLLAARMRPASGPEPQRFTIRSYQD